MNLYLVLASLNLCIGGLAFLLGFLILRENARHRLNRVVAFTLFFGGVGSILGALGFLAARPAVGATTMFGPAPPAGIFQHFAYLWEFFFPTLFLFAALFPEERPFARRVRSFGAVVFAPHVAHFLLLLGVTLFQSNVLIPRLSDGARPGLIVSLGGVAFDLFLRFHRGFFSFVNLAYGVATALLLIESYRRAQVPRLKEQLRVIGFGLTGCLALYSLASPAPTLLNVAIPGWVQSLLTTAALTVGSGAIAYSIVRYKFLDTKLLARRAILYAVASAALVGFYLVVLGQATQLVTRLTGVEPRVLGPVFLIIALVLFQPAISWLEKRLEAVFLRDPTDYRNVLRSLGREIMTTIDLDLLLSRSIRTIAEALMLRSAHIVALSRDGALAHTGAGEPIARPDLQRLGEVIARLPGVSESQPIRVAQAGARLEPADRALLVERLGAALVLPMRSRGEAVGALLLGEKVAGTDYTAEDASLLSALADQMSVSLQNALLLRDRVAMARMEEELSLARRIQRAFLPSVFPQTRRFDVHAINIPSKEVGGDLYDLVLLGDGAFFLAIADVSGKGVPAALLSSMLQASLRTQAPSVRSVSTIMRNINTLVYQSTTPEQFATFFLAHVDEENLRISFSNAGHNFPVVLRSGGERICLDRGGVLLGVLEETPFEEDAVPLHPGDRVLFYTDGVSEAMNGSGEEFGEERLCDLVAGLPGELTSEQVSGRVLAGLRDFLGGVEPQDDITVMVLQVAA
jgi:serine phosphatase RsbU (regulator of sigma subunit)